MFENVTERVRRAVVFAQEEARALQHHHIGSEHILLGLVHEGEGTAARTLDSLGITAQDVHRQVEEVVGRGEHAPDGHIPFSGHAKKIFEGGRYEAQQLGHDDLGTDHLLLALTRLPKSAAGSVLLQLGAEPERVRLEVLRQLPEVRDQHARSAQLDVITERLDNIETSLAAIVERLDTIENKLRG